MIKLSLILHIFSACIFASSQVESDDALSESPGLQNIPAEVQELMFCYFPAPEILSMSRTCKTYHSLASPYLKSKAWMISGLLPYWFSIKEGSDKYKDLKQALYVLFRGLKTGEPVEDFMVEVMETEIFGKRAVKQNESGDFMIALERYPGIVSEILKHKVSQSSAPSLPFLDDPEVQCIQYLDLELLQSSKVTSAEFYQDCFNEYLVIPTFDLIKICDFFDYHKDLRKGSVTFSPTEFFGQAEIYALGNVFTGKKEVLDYDELPGFFADAILLLRASREEKLRFLKTLTGRTDIMVADDCVLYDVVIDHIEKSVADLHELTGIIAMGIFGEIPKAFLAKLLDAVKIEKTPEIVLGFLVNDYPSEFYEKFSGKSKQATERLLLSNPSQLTESEIEAAILFLSDLEPLYNTIASLQSRADYTDFHLFLVLSSKKCSQDLKLKFVLLTSAPVHLSKIPSGHVYEFGTDFVEPLMAALKTSPTEALIHFCTFSRYDFHFLFRFKQYKLFALKLHAMLLMGIDVQDSLQHPPTFDLFIDHLLKPFSTEELQSLLDRNIEYSQRRQRRPLDNGLIANSLKRALELHRTALSRRTHRKAFD